MPKKPITPRPQPFIISIPQFPLELGEFCVEKFGICLGKFRLQFYLLGTFHDSKLFFENRYPILEGFNFLD